MRIILAFLDISYWQEVIEGLASDLFIADHYEKIKIKLDELYQMDFNPLPPLLLISDEPYLQIIIQFLAGLENF